MPDAVPGFDTIKETEEAQIWGAGPDNNHQRFETKIHIKSTVTDSGNTPTTTLRAGFVLARKSSDGLDYAYSGTANDGTQLPIGILEKYTSMLDRYGTAQDKVKNVMKGGLIKSYTADLIGYDEQAMAVLLRTGFMLMDANPHGGLFLVRHRKRQIKSADYTVVAADNGDLFLATDAVNFTLPTKANGLSFEFLQTSDNNMVITGSSDIIADGNAAASTLTFSTGSHKIGSHVRISCVYVDTSGTLKWIYENLGGTTMSVA